MFKLYRSVLAAGAVALGLAACGDNVTVTNPPTPTPLVHSVTVVPASQTVTVGQAGVTFVASVVADSGKASTVGWTSTNSTVATVNPTTGLISALAPGQATIVATSTADPTKTGAGSLTVVALPSNIISFVVTPSNGAIAVGGVLQANSAVTLSAGAPAATVTWASSNAAIASVGASTGTITGVASGTAIITATATSGTQTATATVGVQVGTGPTGVQSFSVSPSSVTLFAGSTQQETATVVSPGFTYPVTWASLAPSVATVSASGLITGVAQGSAIVTATIGTAPNTLTQNVNVTVSQGASISIAAVNAGATSGTVPGCSGTAGLPVVLANVNCQIDVVLNLTAGIQPLDSLVIYVQHGTAAAGAPTFQGRAVPVCAAASAPCAFYITAARQQYGNTIPSTGPVSLSIFTQNFTKNPTTGVALVNFYNGPTSLISQLYPHNLTGGAVTDCQIASSDATCAVVGSMIFTNTDGWAADIGRCETANTFPGPACAAPVLSVVAPGGTNASTGGFAIGAPTGGNVNTTGTTFTGGPTNSGMTVAELYPVVYNDNPAFPSGSSLNRCNNTRGDGTGCITTVTWTIGAPNVAVSVVPGPGTIGSNCGYVANANAGVGVSTQTTQPFIQRFGSGTGANINPCSGYQNVTAIRDNITMASATAFGVNASGPPLDGVNNPYPTVGVSNATNTANTGLIPNVMTFGATPDSARYDYCLTGCVAGAGGAGVVASPLIAGAEGFNWVNQNWVFKPGNSVTDFGVGPSTASWQAFASANGGPLSGPNNNLVFTFPTLIVNGAGPLAETNVNCVPTSCGAGADGYVARAWATDRLGNFGGSTLPTPANVLATPLNFTFGVDRTAPVIRYSDPAAPSVFPSTYTGGGAGLAVTYFDSTTYNAFEGIYGANVVLAGGNTNFIGAAAGTNDSARIEALDNRSGISRFVENTNRFLQGGNALTGTTVSMYSTTAGAVGPSTIDGWLPSPALNVINGRATPGVAPVTAPGYYTTTEYVVDRAGNLSGCPNVPAANANAGIVAGSFFGPAGVGGFLEAICTPGPTTTVPSTTVGSNVSIQAGPGANQNLLVRRTLALDPGQPAVTGVSPNFNYTGNAPETFTLGAQDDLEVIDSRLRILYPNVSIGDAAATASNGLVWSYALSSTFMGFSPNGATSAGPSSAFPVVNTGSVFGYFLPAGLRFDNSIINPIITGAGTVPAMTLDQFTLAVQETCLASASPATLCSAATNGGGVVTGKGHNGDPEDIVASTKPNTVAVQVRDVFGSWIFNSIPGAATGVSAELASPILSSSVAPGTNYAVYYGVAGATTSCPQGGVVQLAGTQSCVVAGPAGTTSLNWRAEPTLSTPGSIETFRATEPLSTTLPLFTRVDLYGLNAAGEWVFIMRCAVPPAILPNTGAQPCAPFFTPVQPAPPAPPIPGFFQGTVTGTDNGNERYWIYQFQNVSGGTLFTQYRALGVNSAGNGIFSTRQP